MLFKTIMFIYDILTLIIYIGTCIYYIDICIAVLTNILLSSYFPIKYSLFKIFYFLIENAINKISLFILFKHFLFIVNTIYEGINVFGKTNVKNVQIKAYVHII